MYYNNSKRYPIAVLQYHARYCFDTEKVRKGVDEKEYKQIKIYN